MWGEWEEQKERDGWAEFKVKRQTQKQQQQQQQQLSAQPGEE